MKGTFCPSQEKIPRGESRGRQGQELVTGSDKSQLLSQGRGPQWVLLTTRLLTGGA